MTFHDLKKDFTQIYRVNTPFEIYTKHYTHKRQNNLGQRCLPSDVSQLEPRK